MEGWYLSIVIGLSLKWLTAEWSFALKDELPEFLNWLGPIVTVRESLDRTRCSVTTAGLGTLKDVEVMNTFFASRG